VTQSAAPTTYTTLYVHDLDDHIIAETDTSGQTLREYIWLGDIPLAVVDKVATGSPVIYYVHSDHLGRPARMTAQNQAWVWDVIYSPFGETSYIWTNPGAIDIRFPGQWFQLESGLHYNWHRHYDASLGRYVQPDPIGFAGGRNIFAYASGNPLFFIDPQGFGPWGSAIGGWIGGVVFGAIGAETGPADIAIAILGRKLGAEFGSELEDYIREKIREADELYPKKACDCDEWHHIVPIYLGGRKSGLCVPLRPSYHQLITNEFRLQRPYGIRRDPLGQEELKGLLTGIYTKFPPIQLGK
jgi:RHS repeat-associated protein